MRACSHDKGSPQHIRNIVTPIDNGRQTCPGCLLSRKRILKVDEASIQPGHQAMACSAGKATSLLCKLQGPSSSRALHPITWQLQSWSCKDVNQVAELNNWSFEQYEQFPLGPHASFQGPQAEHAINPQPMQKGNACLVAIRAAPEHEHIYLIVLLKAQGVSIFMMQATGAEKTLLVSLLESCKAGYLVSFAMPLSEACHMLENATLPVLPGLTLSSVIFAA